MSPKSQPASGQTNPSKGFSKESGLEKSSSPTGQAKKTAKKAAKSSPALATKKPSNAGKQSEIAARAFAGIPETVSRRMARRMALFCGIPTALGMLTFIVSYFIVSQHLLKLPTVAVLLVSLGFFGLGVLGLSYGSLSASWDENRVGSWFGWSEFRTNFRRTIDSWQAPKNES